MPATRTQIWDTDNEIKSHTTTERNALFVSDGHMVYNSEDDEMQGYDGSTSSWVSLTLPDDLCPEVPATAVAAHTHDGYAASDHEHTLTADDLPDHTHEGIVGPKGEKGDKGDKGDQGDQGDPGPKGDMGDPGTAGMDGAPGQDGAQGPAGEDGEDGQPGQPGAQGARGPRGYTGATGATGATGPQGPKGDKGDTPSIPPSHSPDYHDDRYALKNHAHTPPPETRRGASAFGRVNAAGSLVGSNYNIASVSRTGSDRNYEYTLNFSSAIPNAEAVIMVMPEGGKKDTITIKNRSTSSFTVRFHTGNNRGADAPFSFVVYG
ncbi:MAG: hypothetical protein OXG26_09030 [Caldilineaceae bacterium]|nr:hypothetical protein [Caldilineaceae bacterium]